MLISSTPTITEGGAMDPRELKKLADLFSHDLDGWQIGQCYFLELDHGLMASFPAINEKKEIIATLEEAALEMVWKKLERRPFHVTSCMVVAHLATGVAFSLQNPWKGETKPLRIFSAEAIKELSKEGGVRWTPGLV